MNIRNKYKELLNGTIGLLDERSKIIAVLDPLGFEFIAPAKTFWRLRIRPLPRGNTRPVKRRYTVSGHVPGFGQIELSRFLLLQSITDPGQLLRQRLIVDHINGDRRDTTFFNLRVVTKSENQWNRYDAGLYRCWACRTGYTHYKFGIVIWGSSGIQAMTIGYASALDEAEEIARQFEENINRFPVSLK